MIAGTYVKTAWVPQFGGGGADLYMVVYLRPSGRFLWLGYWPLYEMSYAGGVWRAEEQKVVLTGVARISGDFQLEPGPLRRFERTLHASIVDQTPALLAEAGISELSLLGWQGSFVYVGTSVVIKPEVLIDPAAAKLPSSLAEVDGWIDRIATKPHHP